MSVTGKVVDGLIVLPPGVRLPEGAVVKVETIEAVPPSGLLVAAVEKLAKPRPHLPADYALKHAHRESDLAEVAAETWDKLGPAPTVLYDQL